MPWRRNRSDRERGVSLASAVEQSRDALSLARARYSSGVANFIDVLDAERSLQQNELALATNTTAISTDPGGYLPGAGRRLGGRNLTCHRGNRLEAAT